MKNEHRRRYVVIRVKQGILTIDRVLKMWSLTQGNIEMDWGSTQNGCEYFKVLPGRRVE